MEAQLSIKKPKTGREALAASPKAVALLGLQKRTEIATTKPIDWFSARELNRQFVGGPRVIEKKLLWLSDLLVADLENMGFLKDDATNLVENHLIGRRKPERGPEAWAISPDGLRIAEECGMLTRRRDIAR